MKIRSSQKMLPNKYIIRWEELKNTDIVGNQEWCKEEEEHPTEAEARLAAMQYLINAAPHKRRAPTGADLVGAIRNMALHEIVSFDELLTQLSLESVLRELQPERVYSGDED